MKYLAILKDSLREAIDTKVFYVMVGLSLVVILFTAQGGLRCSWGRASWNRAHHPSLSRALSTARITSAHSWGVATEVSTSMSYVLNACTSAC